jgi:deazaflavin-dependent oxidoreductase (nitroreductase family)
MKEFNQSIIDEFRSNEGVVGGPFEGASLLLLRTIGAKSCLARTNPLAYLREDDQLIVIASYAGAPSNPPWYYNLLANPEVRVEVGIEKFTALASVVDEPDRSALYAKMASVMPDFSKYQAKTSRIIPVVALTRK